MNAGDGREGGGYMEDLIQKFAARREFNCVPANGSNPLDTLKRAFQSLSLEEQQKIRRDQHGIEEPIEESTAFISSKLAELEREIHALDEKTKRAYTEAIQQEIEHVAAAEVAAIVETCRSGDHQRLNNEEYKFEKAHKELDSTNLQGETKQRAKTESCKEYVQSKSFHLMFLRAENFNPRMAAKRITRYFKEKKDLFGVARLPYKIKQVDLRESDMKVLTSGCISCTGATDKQGRLIVFVCRKFMDNIADVDSIRRAAYYFFQIVENQEDWQKKGIVIVVDGRGMGLTQPASERRFYPYIRTATLALPFRTSCSHVCYDSNALHFFLKLCLVVIPLCLRRRLQFHQESNSEECFAALSEYGINLEDLPLTDDREFRPDSVVHFLDALRQDEEAAREPLLWLVKELEQWL